MTPLRQRMLEDMSIRNFAENTQLSYVQQSSALLGTSGVHPRNLDPSRFVSTRTIS